MFRNAKGHISRSKTPQTITQHAVYCDKSNRLTTIVFLFHEKTLTVLSWHIEIFSRRILSFWITQIQQTADAQKQKEYLTTGQNNNTYIHNVIKKGHKTYGIMNN